MYNIFNINKTLIQFDIDNNFIINLRNEKMIYIYKIKNKKIILLLF